jgi:hypothetical protein
VVLATAAPVASPTPSSSSVYTSAALGYRVELPRPWRLACNSNAEQPLGESPVADFFTAAPETSERWGDTGYPFDVVYVSVRPNPDRLTAQQWVTNGQLGGCCVSGAGPQLAPTTIDGRAAVTFSGGGPFGEMAGLAVASGDRMYEATSVAMQPPTNVSAMTAIVRSFHLLSEAERSRLPRPTSGPPRSAEAVADALAAGFARMDSGALASLLGKCVTLGAVSGGVGAAASAAFIEDLRAEIAAGRTVAVATRPVLDYAADVIRLRGTRYVRSTWTRPNLGPEAVDLLLQADGDRWYWAGTLTRFP